MRKGRIKRGVVLYVRRLVTVHGGFYIDDDARLRAWINRTVMNAASGAMIAAELGIRFARGRHRESRLIELDRNPHVDAYFANCVRQVLVAVRGISAYVRDHNQAAAPQDHLVNSEVFKVATV